MTRPLRIEFAGAVYHVTARGDACAHIFLDVACVMPDGPTHYHDREVLAEGAERVKFTNQDLTPLTYEQAGLIRVFSKLAP